MMKCIVVFVFVILSVHGYGQQGSACTNPFYLKSYGNQDSSLFTYDMILTGNDEVIACGDIRNNSIGKFDDGFIIKWNKDGTIIWQRTFSFDAGQAIHKLAKLRDGNYVALGSDGRTGSSAYFLLKFDNNGNTIWKKEFVFSGINITSIAGLAEDEKQEIIITGYFLEGNLSFNDHGYFIKFDASGNILLSKRLNPPVSFSVFIPQASVILDGYSYIAGYHFSPDAKGLLIKVDNTDGNVVWSKVYDYNGKEANFTQILKYPGNRLCLIGSNSYQALDTNIVFITDTSGNVQLSKSLYFHTISGVGKATVDNSGNIIWSNFYKRNYPGEFALLSINPSTGVNWSKSYPQLNASASGIAFASDSSIVMAGTTTPGNYVYMTFLAKFSKNGFVGCSPLPFASSLYSGTTNASTVNVTSEDRVFPSVTNAFTILSDQIKPGNDICDYQVNCTTLKLTGPDTICTMTDSVRVGITKTKDCPLIPELLYDTAKLSLYLQDDTSAIFTIRAAGLIKIKARMINRCDTLADSIDVKIYNNPTEVHLGADTVLCTSSSLVLKAGKNFKSYIWQDSSTDSNLTVNKAGLYYVAVTDSCNNIYRDTIDISDDIPLPFDLGPDVSKCNDDSIRITAPAGFASYSWNPVNNISPVTGRSIVVYPSIDTKYFATAKKTNGCLVTDSILITIKHSKPVHFINDTSICDKDSIILNAGSAFIKYSWNTGDTQPSIKIKTAGAYTVSATDVNDCVSKDTFRLKNVYPLPVFSLGNDMAICRGTNYDLKPGTFTSFVWQDNSKNSIYTVSKPGKYWVQVIDSNKCKSVDTITITGYKELPVSFLPDTVSMCEGETIILKPSTTFAKYSWNEGSSEAFISVRSKGVYWLKATNNEGCTNADTTIVSYKDCYKVVYFPSAFTPNQDGKNDLFRGVSYGVLDGFHLIIVNRFGQKVFETLDADKGWDGKVNSIPQNTGTFAWYCTYHFSGETQKSRTEKGTVVLVR